MKGTVSLQELYEKYHDRVQFLKVYIREAHPVDGWWLGKGIFGVALRLSRLKAATDVYDPKTMEERRKEAHFIINPPISRYASKRYWLSRSGSSIPQLL